MIPIRLFMLISTSHPLTLSSILIIGTFAKIVSTFEQNAAILGVREDMALHRKEKNVFTQNARRTEVRKCGFGTFSAEGAGEPHDDLAGSVLGDGGAVRVKHEGHVCVREVGAKPTHGATRQMEYTLWRRRVLERIRKGWV